MTTITFEHEGKEYTLAYNREAVRQMEATGFDISQITTMPVTRIPELFYGAFHVFHRGIKRKLVDAIYDNMDDKTNLTLKLGEMYAETIEDLMATHEDDKGKKTLWKVGQ